MSALRVPSATARFARADLARRTDQPAREPVAQPIEAARVLDDLDALEARAQGCGVGIFAAQAAADALLRIDPGDRVGAQRIAGVAHAEGRTAGDADAGMVAGADVLVDAVTHPQHPLAGGEPTCLLWPGPALALELAFAFGDDHLEAGRIGGERLG